MLLRRQANKSQPVTLRHFSHWPRRIGSAGEGVSGARRHDRVGRCRKLKSEGEKREGESCWKSGGGRVRLYTWRSAGLADEVAMPDAAGGEAVTGPLNRKG
jgi:hypothetical protein